MKVLSIRLSALTVLLFGSLHTLRANDIQHLICEAGKNFGQAVARAHIATEFKSVNMGAQRQAMFDNLDNAVRFVSDIESSIPEPFATIRKDNNYARLISSKVEQLKSKWDGLPLHQRVNEVDEIYKVFLGSLRYTYNTDRPDVIQQKPTCDSKIIQVCYDFGMAMIASETAGDPDRPLFVEQYHQSANSAMIGDIEAGLDLAMDPGHRPFNGHSEKICCGFGSPADWAVFPRFTSESPIVAYLSAEIILENIIINANPSQECASGTEHCVSYNPKYHTDSGPPIPPEIDYFDCWDTGNPNWFKPSYMTDGCSYDNNEYTGVATIYLNIGVYIIQWRRQYGEMDLNAVLGGPKAPDHCNPQLEPVRTVQMHRISDPRKEYTYTHPTKAIYVIFRPNKNREDLGRSHYEPLAIRYMKQIEPYAMVCSGNRASGTSVSNTGSGATELVPLEFEVDHVSFFESGNEPTEKARRRYATRFSAAESRTINWELNIDYAKVFGKKEVPVYYIIYKPNRKVMAHGKQICRIESGWSSSHHAYGWGWNSPGNWTPGDYEVLVYAYGKKIADARFAMIDDLEASAAGRIRSKEEWHNDLRGLGLRVFESDYDVTPFGSRSYTNAFDAASLKYICFEVEIGSPPPKQVINFNMEYVYKNGQGNEIFRQTFEASYPSDVSSRYYANGYGNRTPGKAWKPGKYTVEVFVDGTSMGSAEFEVR